MSKYTALYRRLTNGVEFIARTAVREFTRELSDRMRLKNLKNIDLAEKIGSSPAYVSKVMRGEANFTLETMVKLALAVDSRIHITLDDSAAYSASTVMRFAKSSSVNVPVRTESHFIEVAEKPPAANDTFVVVAGRLSHTAHVASMQAA